MQTLTARWSQVLVFHQFQLKCPPHSHLFIEMDTSGTNGSSIEKLRKALQLKLTGKQCLELAVILYAQKSLYIQFVGDHIFRYLIKTDFEVIEQATSTNTTEAPEELEELTPEETYGIRYTAGYVLRSLKKKLGNSSHQLNYILLDAMFRISINLINFNLIDHYEYYYRF